jgi:hypothetical protein
MVDSLEDLSDIGELVKVLADTIFTGTGRPTEAAAR